MERISITELIREKRLKVPEVDEVLLVADMLGGHRFRDCGGVYLFFTKHHEPLYVGISHNLGKRTVEHLGSLKGNKDLVSYMQAHPFAYCAVFYEPSKALQELYENYLILILEPRYNILKTDLEKF